MERGSGEMRSALSLLIPFFSCWLCMAVSFLLRHSECSGRSTVRGWHSLCAEVDQHYLYSAIGVLQRTRVCRMRCSVVSIAWSQRAIKLHSSRCAARKMLFNTCPSNPISSRSSMVSSNWCCNLMAAILTRWKKRSCCSKMRTWSEVALRAALSMEKVRSAPHWAWCDTLARVDWWKRNTITGKL